MRSWRYEPWWWRTLDCTWMQTDASLILTNCFLSSWALKRRCSVMMRLRTSVWSKACSRWRSASRRNTWGEWPWWSQHGVTHTHLMKNGHTHTHTHILWNHWPDTWSQVCQVWSSNYIDSIPEAWSAPSCLIHWTHQIWGSGFITSLCSEGGCCQVIWGYHTQHHLFPTSLTLFIDVQFCSLIN